MKFLENQLDDDYLPVWLQVGDRRSQQGYSSGRGISTEDQGPRKRGCRCKPCKCMNNVAWAWQGNLGAWAWAVAVSKNAKPHMHQGTAGSR